jgi:phage uncharacterized protein TIGR01671
MRTIKFRAKRLMNGSWVYGDLHLLAAHPHIHPTKGVSYLIKEDTIGQFTSLFDNNGKEIYEGDILALAGVETERLEVRFVRGVFAFLWNGNLDEECPLDAPTHCCVEVIGNIHDNPELLKGGKKCSQS